MIEPSRREQDTRPDVIAQISEQRNAPTGSPLFARAKPQIGRTELAARPVDPRRLHGAETTVLPKSLRRLTDPLVKKPVPGTAPDDRGSLLYRTMAGAAEKWCFRFVGATPSYRAVKITKANTPFQRATRPGASE